MIAEDMVVMLSEADGGGYRAAVVVWFLPDGAAWVEPGYIDPMGASSRMFHRIRGSAREAAGAYEVTTADKVVYFWRPYEETREDLKAAFAWYAMQLEQQGKTRQGEAAALQELLAQDLA